MFSLRWFILWPVSLYDLYFAAHLNHLMEIYSAQNFSLLKASMIVGMY